ncbi:MAG: chemotaxis protein CheC [Chloroflexota bacterium]|nr:chemotaxis protein CheC [Chloroflexota bacterium]
MVEQKTRLSEIEHSVWTELVSKAIVRSISSLSQMVGQTITVPTLDTRPIDIKEVAYLFGGPEALIVGVYLRVSGSVEGQIMLVYSPQAAFELLDLLMGEAPGTTQNLGEMEMSGLGEIGNTMGAHFLNYLADSTGLSLNPSPPAVMMDMAGAILDAALAEIMRESDETWIVEATFGTEDYQHSGTFLVMLTPELLRVLTEHWSHNNSEALPGNAG